MALHAGRAATGRRLLPGSRWSCWRRATSSPRAATSPDRPLPYIDVTADFADVFPARPTSVGLGARARQRRSSRANVVETDADDMAAPGRRSRSSPPQPDTACSRILCPRKLEPKTGYHAFLVPAFESGRLAGLGLDPQPLFDDAANGLTATSSAWGAYGVPANRPSRRASRTTTAGTSAPAETATSSRWSGCSSPSPSTAGSGTATWTSPTRRRTSPASTS